MDEREILCKRRRRRRCRHHWGGRSRCRSGTSSRTPPTSTVTTLVSISLPSGLRKGTLGGDCMGASLLPDRLGRSKPLATNATASPSGFPVRPTVSPLGLPSLPGGRRGAACWQQHRSDRLLQHDADRMGAAPLQRQSSPELVSRRHCWRHRARPPRGRRMVWRMARRWRRRRRRAGGPLASASVVPLLPTTATATRRGSRSS